MHPRKQNFLRARYARLEHVDRDVIGQMKAFSCVLDALCAHIALCVHSGARGTAAATPSTHDYIRAIGTSARLRKRLTILAILGIWEVCSSKIVPRHNFGDFEVWRRQPPDFGLRGRLRSVLAN